VDDAVGSGRHGLVVSDEHDRRGAVPAQPLEESKDHVDRCAVEASGGFVGQQHYRVVDQCTGDRDPLALAPRAETDEVPAPLAVLISQWQLTAARSVMT
jgi:hypothetical protein